MSRYALVKQEILNRRFQKRKQDMFATVNVDNGKVHIFVYDQEDNAIGKQVCDRVLKIMRNSLVNDKSGHTIDQLLLKVMQEADLAVIEFARNLSVPFKNRISAALIAETSIKPTENKSHEKAKDEVHVISVGACRITQGDRAIASYTTEYLGERIDFENSVPHEDSFDNIPLIIKVANQEAVVLQQQLPFVRNSIQQKLIYLPWYNLLGYIGPFVSLSILTFVGITYYPTIINTFETLVASLQTETPAPTSTPISTPTSTATTAAETPEPTVPSPATAASLPPSRPLEPLRPTITATQTTPQIAKPTPGETAAIAQAAAPTNTPQAQSLPIPFGLSDLSITQGDMVNFSWRAVGPTPEGYGYEVRVWHGEGAHTGVHDAQKTQNLIVCPQDNCTFQTRISTGPGEYSWAVAVVSVAPYNYGSNNESQPAKLTVKAPPGQTVPLPTSVPGTLGE